MWYIHMEYYLAIKKNEILIHVTTWMTLENIMLSERSQLKKVTDYMIPFIGNAQNRQTHKNRKQISISQGSGWEMEEMECDC